MHGTHPRGRYPMIGHRRERAVLLECHRINPGPHERSQPGKAGHPAEQIRFNGHTNYLPANRAARRVMLVASCSMIFFRASSALASNAGRRNGFAAILDVPNSTNVQYHALPETPRLNPTADSVCLSFTTRMLI